MKSLKIVALIAIAMLIASAVVAMDKTPEERGKALFSDPMLGGTEGKSCSSCHPDGKGLDKASSKAEGKTQEAINSCMSNAHSGKTLQVNSEQMKDLMSYIKSIKPAGEAPAKKKGAVGC